MKRASLIVELLLGTVLVSGGILSRPPIKISTSATTASTSAPASVTVLAACTLTSETGTTDNPAHTATLSPTAAGHYASDIGLTSISISCNDASGWALYAIGDGTGTNKTDLVNSLNPTITIPTGVNTAGNTSSWAMKLLSGAGTNLDNTTGPILSTYANYAAIPSTNTKVASLDRSSFTSSGSSLKTTYAVYASPTQTAGAYTGKVKYTLVHPYTNIACDEHYENINGVCQLENFTIAATANNSSYGSVSPVNFSAPYGSTLPSSDSTNATITINDVAMIATPASGYEFTNWTHNCGTNLTSDCVITANFAVAQMTFARAYAAAGKSQTSGHYRMQDMTSDICSAVDTGQTASLVDVRAGNKVYTVAKLADGKCWMLDNLALGLDWDTITLTSSDSHVSSNYTLPAGFGGTTWVDSYTASYIYTAAIYDDVTSFGAGNGEAGIYYNYCAASAGTICVSSNNTNASSDICPKGWRLPIGGDNSNDEFRSLYYTAYKQNTSTFRTALAVTFAGVIISGSHSVKNSAGSFWTSTKSTTIDMYVFNIEYAGNSFSGGPREYGRSIRCVNQ